MDTEFFIFAQHDKPPSIDDLLQQLVERDLPFAWVPTLKPGAESEFDWCRGMLLSIPEGDAQISVAVEPGDEILEDLVAAYDANNVANGLLPAVTQYRIVVDQGGVDVGDRAAVNLVDLLMADSGDSAVQIGTKKIESSQQIRERWAHLLPQGDQAP